MIREPVVIVGAGPAGLAAAIQLKRQGIDPLIFERDAIGGLLRNANKVENYPGFPGCPTGAQLVRCLEQQARHHALRIRFDEVVKLDFKAGVFRINTQAEEFVCRIAVVASGTKPRQFSGFRIPTGAADRVIYEIHACLHLSGKTFAIVGGGDAAFDYALNLARHNRVFLLNRSKTTKCLPTLLQRVREHPRITYLDKATITRIEPDSSGRLLLRYAVPHEITKLSVHYLVGAIGRDPQKDFLSDRVREMTSKLVRQRRLYFIGDVRRGAYRQAAISVGDGVLAAMRIHRQRKEIS